MRTVRIRVELDTEANKLFLIKTFFVEHYLSKGSLAWCPRAPAWTMWVARGLVLTIALT